MKPTTDQVVGVADRLLTVLVMWLLMKAVMFGWISESDATSLGPIIVAFLAGLWGWWNNRPKAILVAAARLPDTKVVTTPDLAASVPSNNVVSNSETTVVPRLPGS